jgi:hypothetical protein
MVKENDFWYPRLLFFRDFYRPTIPLFERAEEHSEFLNLAKLLGVTTKAQLEAIVAPPGMATTHPYDGSNAVIQLLNVPKLDTRA